jgi:hypothetical protein
VDIRQAEIGRRATERQETGGPIRQNPCLSPPLLATIAVPRSLIPHGLPGDGLMFDLFINTYVKLFFLLTPFFLISTFLSMIMGMTSRQRQRIALRTIEFGRYAASRRSERGEGKPETFDFLGFTHCCGKTRKG